MESAIYADSFALVRERGPRAVDRKERNTRTLKRCKTPVGGL